MKRLLNKHRAGLPPVGREVQIRDVCQPHGVMLRMASGVCNRILAGLDYLRTSRQVASTRAEKPTMAAPKPAPTLRARQRGNSARTRGHNSHPV